MNYVCQFWNLPTSEKSQSDELPLMSKAYRLQYEVTAGFIFHSCNEGSQGNGTMVVIDCKTKVCCLDRAGEDSFRRCDVCEGRARISIACDAR